MIDFSDEFVCWLLRVAGIVGGLILVDLVRRFVRARPCWFFNHKMKHLSIERRIFPPNGICHRCNEVLPPGESWTSSYRHFPHRNKDGSMIPCYVTRWICAKEGCGEMGIFCVGGKNDGAWTVRNGEIVPDEKEWSRFE